MMNESSSREDEMKNALQALRRSYVAAWPEKHAGILENFRKANENEDAQEELTSLRFAFHKLAGTGTTYGFPEVTKRAREAEEIVAGCLYGRKTFSDEDLAQLQSLIHALDGIFRGGTET